MAQTWRSMHMVLISRVSALLNPALAPGAETDYLLQFTSETQLIPTFTSMISLVSVKLPKFIVKVLFPLVALLGIVTLVSVHSGVTGTALIEVLRAGANSTFGTGVMASGHRILPQNVVFQFIDTKNKQGPKEDVLKINTATYDEVMHQEILVPKDMDVSTIGVPEDPASYVRANATIMALVRNDEIRAIERTMRQFEKKFNSKFRYPYTFLNDEPFDEKFMARIRTFTQAEVNFVHIPPEVWNKPEWVDTDKEATNMDRLEKLNVAYAKKASYHNMCRFYSKSFYNLPEMQKYKYYWRIEPGVKFYTDLGYDVFKYLAHTQKLYGFTINLYDIDESIETLFPETIKFLNEGDNYKYVNENGAFQWITENQQNPKKARVANGYSTCHFWSNFEIADMDFYRGEAYSQWVEYLDRTGNFYYERWGDAPVHSLGLALFADKRRIHWFRDIGYWHAPYTNCPRTGNTRGCLVGKFDDSNHNLDQNCMATWIDYEAGDLGAIY